MDAAQIGVTASSYEGNAALGGGTFGAFKLDLRPIEDLAKYTFLYNKSEYEQRQKDAEAAAKEIADMTNYDLTSGIEKDAKILQQKYDKIIAYVRDNPNALDYRNKKEWMEYKRMRNDLDNDLQGAKVRHSMWGIRQKEIQDAKTPEEKARLQKELNDEIAATDIRTPLKHSNQWNVQPVEVSAAPIKKVSVSQIGKNFFGKDSWEMPDMDAVTNQSLSISSGLMQAEDFENTDSFKSKTPQEQELFRKQFEASKASGKLEPIESSKNISAAISTLIKDPNYKNADGSVNYQKIVDEGKDPTGVIQQALIYNQKMDEMTGYIDKGLFKDDFGKELHFGNDASGLRKSSYAKINLDDGISPQELVKMRILAVSPATKREVEVKETGLATQLRGQDLSYKASTNAQYMENIRAGYVPDKNSPGGWKFVGKPSDGGTGTLTQLAQYPIQKTDEILTSIGTSSNFSDLSSEQQERIKSLLSVDNAGVKSSKLADGDNISTVSVNGDIITVKTGKSGTFKIKADDITKSYYDEINRNDAGKENVQRIYYTPPSKRGGKPGWTDPSNAPK